MHAQQAVEAQLDRLISRETLDTELARGATFADVPPESLIQRGTGWGALEQLRRRVQGLPPFCSPALVFDAASLDEAQDPWVQLLKSGTFPEHDPQKAPPGFMIQTEWHDMLEDMVKVDGHGNWAAWMHVGIMRHQTGDFIGAHQAWETSMALCATPWSARNLAILAWQEQRCDDAAALYTLALELQPDIPQLAIECGRKLLEMERPHVWLSLLDILPEAIRNIGRIRLLEGQAALAVDDLDRVASLFEGTLVIDDLREGERSLSHLWYNYHEQRLSKELGTPVDDVLRAAVRQEYPVPEDIDFRMSGDTPIAPQE